MRRVAPRPVGTIDLSSLSSDCGCVVSLRGLCSLGCWRRHPGVDRGVIGEDPYQAAAALDFLVYPLQQVGSPDCGSSDLVDTDQGFTGVSVPVAMNCYS